MCIFSKFISKLKGSPLSEAEICFFRVYFGFQLWMCMMVYFIRAMKTRTILSWIVSEKAKCLKPMLRKFFFALVGKLFQLLLFNEVFSQFRTTEKSGGKNSFWNYFMFISKPDFEQQQKVFPFLVEILFLSNLAGLTKFRRSKKHWLLTRSSVFYFSWPVKTIFFKRKKKMHPHLVPVTREKSFNLNGWSPDFCREKQVLAFVTPKTPWRKHLRIGTLWRTLLYSSIPIHPKSFISFRPAVFWETRKGGSP